MEVRLPKKKVLKDMRIYCRVKRRDTPSSFLTGLSKVMCHNERHHHIHTHIHLQGINHSPNHPTTHIRNHRASCVSESFLVQLEDI